MIAAIMQPTYLPWIGYFDLIDSVDTFVFLDDAQVLKRSWGVRNRILGKDGKTMLTVPLAGHNQADAPTFFATATDPAPKWRRTHLATIRHAYAKAPHFEEVYARLEALLTGDHVTIGALNIAFIEDTARRMGIVTPLEASSQMPGLGGRKDTRLLAICRKVGADAYLSARGSAAYIEQDRAGGAFANTDVMLRYHHYVHPAYDQGCGGFVSHMSVIDLLMRRGYADALGVIRSGRRPMLTSAELQDVAA